MFGFYNRIACLLQVIIQQKRAGILSGLFSGKYRAKYALLSDKLCFSDSKNRSIFTNDKLDIQHAI